MKRIIFSLVLVVLLATLALATVSTQTELQYNSSTNEVTFDVSRGWNMLPIGEGISTTADPQDPDYCQTAASVFIWDSVSGKYLGGLTNDTGTSYVDTQRASDAINSAKESGYAFGSMGAAWAYMTKPCKMTMSFSGNALTGSSGRKILKGWNFITIMPWMAGKSYDDVFGGCTITKANSWQDSVQQWAVDSTQGAANLKSTSNINSSYVGNTLVIYAESDCELDASPGAMEVPGLPA
jgi:hypothetical protein